MNLYNFLNLNLKLIFFKFINFTGKNERTGIKIKTEAAYIAEEVKYCHTFL